MLAGCHVVQKSTALVSILNFRPAGIMFVWQELPPGMNWCDFRDSFF